MYDKTLDYKIAKKYRLFPNAVIKYKIRIPERTYNDNDKADRTAFVESAIRYIERGTCLTFVKLPPGSFETSAEILEILVSNISYQDQRFRFTPRPQDGPDRNAVVEVSFLENYNLLMARLLNAVAGLQYEHQREDRDNYVKILWHNIRKGYEDDFRKIEGYPPNLTGFKEFTLSTVMSADIYYRSANGEPTIEYIHSDSRIFEPFLPRMDGMRVNAIYRQLIHRWYFYGNLFLYKGPLACSPELV